MNERRRYYGYRLESWNQSCRLWLYEHVSRKRPSNTSYIATDHDVEMRWYLDKNNLMNRLDSLGFTREAIEIAELNTIYY